MSCAEPGVPFVGTSALPAVAQLGVPTFARAVLTCLLNPKAYVFMLAVFPQFLRPEQGPIAPQAVALATITGLTQALVYGAVAAAAAGVRGWLRANGNAQVWLGRAVGVLLLAMARRRCGWGGPSASS